MLQEPNGEKLKELGNGLIADAPWLMRALSTTGLEKLTRVHNGLQALTLDKDDPILLVDGFESPPDNTLVSMAMAKSGSSLSSAANASRKWMSSLPILGSMTGMDSRMQEWQEDLSKVSMKGEAPNSESDWSTVAKALKHAQAVNSFQNDIWKPFVSSDKWPEFDFSDQERVREVAMHVERGIEVKRLVGKMKADDELARAKECRDLDVKRGKLASQIQHHAEELVDAAVVAELSRSFSPDAQSALIRFAQIAGAAKFSRSSKPSKMTQRQRRRRQEYLDAFDRCCRFIPCWILTTSQISDYLPAECLFDLVIIDEASQSDVTVLPGMLRGKQWLIVGDGKQVSPTEAFVSEEEIDNLRAALPETPLGNSLLPGQSFFDMCAQAFPRGRVRQTLSV